MEIKDLISVVIPVYNVEQYLQECVDSVLAQTYQNFEIILVNDGSTDTSGELCDYYGKKDSRIQVIHQNNQGLSCTRNNGFKKAKGKYVYFLDSDDWIVSNALERLITTAIEESADVVFFDASSFIDGKPEQKIKQRYLRQHEYKKDLGLNIFEKMQRYKEFHSAVQLLFINREYMERENILFEPNIIYEDMLFTFELLCKAKGVVGLREALYHRRYRENSIMTSKKSGRNYISACTVYEKVNDLAKEMEISKLKLAQEYISRCAFNALNYYKAMEKDEQRLYKKSYGDLKQSILRDNAYENRALKMRCYGTVLWFIYKVYEKTVICLRGK